MLRWLDSLDFSWMAWTWPTALFFGLIVAAIAALTLLAILRPETPRVGILRIPTTRGDRLFVSLLGTAFICLAWIVVTNVAGNKDGSLLGAIALSLVYAGAVFWFA